MIYFHDFRLVQADIFKVPVSSSYPKVATIENPANCFSPGRAGRLPADHPQRQQRSHPAVAYLPASAVRPSRRAELAPLRGAE